MHFASTVLICPMNTLTEDQKETFDRQEARFNELERIVSLCRQFVKDHQEQLSKLKHWYMWGWDTELKVSPAMNGMEAKDIAKLFASEGWEREPDRHSCVSINWKLQINGITVIIEGAENIKPTLKKEVRFT